MMKKYYLGFSHFLGIGPVKFSVLLKKFTDVKRAYNAPAPDLQPVLGSKLTAKFVQFRKEFNLDERLKEIEAKGIRVITQEDDFYSPLLKEISDPPICLYVKGNLENFQFDKDIFFAVVGTRKPTSYGKQTAKRLAYELAAQGVIIVSGLAFGIDAVSHLGALDAGGKTVAVLGCGVDIIYPKENKNIYGRILEEGSIIVSEFPPGRTVLKGLFVARNRIISGFSRGVLVVEGTKKSGSLITASYAASQGRDVFAVPGPINSVQSQAPNMLLKKGAAVTTGAKDIFSSLNIRPLSADKRMKIEGLNEQEEIVYSSLQQSSMLPDDITKLLELPIHKTLEILTGLEIKGIIKTASDGKVYLSS